MADKKKKLNLDPTTVSNGVAVATIVAGAIAGGIGVNNLNDWINNRFDYDTRVQSNYEQSIDIAQRDFEYNQAMQKALGQLPADFDFEQAQTQFVQDISAQKMEQAEVSAKAQEKAETNGTGTRVFTNILGTIAGGFAGVLAGIGTGKGAEAGTKKLNRVMAKRREDEEKVAGQ